MKINIVTAFNGVGLERDAKIMAEILRPHHEINIIDLNRPRVRRADVNIFCEILQPNIMKLAKVNYFIPNPEWYMPQWDRLLPRVEVLAKTRQAAEVFDSKYIGFTSKDFKTDRPKVRRFVHFSGKSSFKGTEQLIEAWRPDYPILYIKRDRNKIKVNKPNIVYNYGRIPEAEYVEYFSESQIHICPSNAEGWGHYIHEAKSAGNVVLTTDGAPMNEFVKGLLIKPESQEPLKRGINYLPSVEDMRLQIERIINMSDKQLNKIGEINRAEYLANDKEFKARLIGLFT